MRFTHQQKLTAASAASVVALGACLWAFWFFASGVARDGAARAEIQARLDELSAAYSRAQVFLALRAERQADFTRILGFLVDRARPIAFLRTLEDLGRAIGATVAIEVDDAGSDREHLGFRVIVEGDGQHRMVRYVRLLERSPYAITVTQITEENESPDAQAGSGPADRLVVSVRVRTR